MGRIGLLHRLKRASVWGMAGALGAISFFVGTTTAYARTYERRPVLFVHGFESAGSNFASQAMRFESNGYPHGWVEELDYNSTAAVGNMSEVEKQIEEAITALKQRTGTSQVAGKALEFPQNTGLAGYTVEVWPVNSNGERSTSSPIAAIPITDGSEAGGAWGPVAVKPNQRYEFALVSPGAAKTIHVYMEPFVRSDYAIRLLGSVPISTEAGKFPGRTGGVQIRYEEYWGDQPGENDELPINGLELCTPSLCPWEKKVNAYFAFDWEGKEESTLNEEPALSKLPFIQAAQVYLRGHTPPDEVVHYQLTSRRGGGLRTLNAPNWEGTTNQVEIFWNDFESLSF